ncbi:hypothetical protein EDC96DRAFT_243339 [Choanephora cucurbitarum]|nr:hypothetical protein EDC96DRAFT_243339 [Choanephora cucurbitarum]
MVSVSSLFFCGLAFVVVVNALPAPETHSLKENHEFNAIVASNFQIQPAGCTDGCCSSARQCCTLIGGTMKNGKCYT